MSPAWNAPLSMHSLLIGKPTYEANLQSHILWAMKSKGEAASYSLMSKLSMPDVRCLREEMVFQWAWKPHPTVQCLSLSLSETVPNIFRDSPLYFIGEPQHIRFRVTLFALDKLDTLKCLGPLSFSFLASLWLDLLYINFTILIETNPIFKFMLGVMPDGSSDHFQGKPP